MTDTLTPGSEWLLPVTLCYSTDWQGETIAHVTDTPDYSLSHMRPYIAAAVDNLIPASRLADLEAEVARWQQLYEDARHDLTKAEMEVERLRAGLTAIWDDTYPRSHQLNGQCKHDRYIHEQCEECIWDYAHSILNPKD
jgi:hypothetical protein